MAKKKFVSRFTQKTRRRNAQSNLLFLLGTVLFVIGVYLSVRSNLLIAIDRGLDGNSENAVIFDIIGVLCLLSGWGIRRAD